MTNNRLLIFAGLIPALLLLCANARAASEPWPDFDGDGEVGFSDFTLLARAFSSVAGDETYELRFDLDQNGRVDFGDFVLFARVFGRKSIHFPDVELRLRLASLLKKQSEDRIFEDELTALIRLSAPRRGITDLTGLEYATNLTHLWLASNKITDITPVGQLRELQELDLSLNEIQDITPLVNLTQLKSLKLQANQITDLSPLLNNTGLGAGDTIDLTQNPVETSALETLRSRGMTVEYGDRIYAIRPLIFRDVLYILPIEENLSRQELPINQYAEFFYGQFTDSFDFLFFIRNVDETKKGDLYPFASWFNVRNDIEGIGTEIFPSVWPFTGNLQGVCSFKYFGINRETGASNLGTLLHEVLHRWANDILDTGEEGHFGYSSQGGWFGGLFHTIESLGGGRWAVAFQIQEPLWYSPIELYLAGLIPADKVPDLTITFNAENLRTETGAILKDHRGWHIITADSVRTFSIEDIIAMHGPRKPAWPNTQKAFRVATILLVAEGSVLDNDFLTSVSDYMLDHSGARLPRGPHKNFYVVTGRRAWLELDNLSRFKR